MLFVKRIVKLQESATTQLSNASYPQNNPFAVIFFPFGFTWLR